MTSIPEARVEAVAVQVVVGHGGLGGAAPRPRHRLGVRPRHARIFSENCSHEIQIKSICDDDLLLSNCQKPLTSVSG